ncbi:MAG: nicotinate-nucleotide--dimethylbenzimidazole phosphoribosyltransferase [Inquilinaceae bacterium]
MILEFPLETSGDIRLLLSTLPGPDAQASARAGKRQDALTKPPGSLGRLERVVQWLAAWQGRDRPRLDRVDAIVFAGNHGVCAQGVAAYPPSVTAQMVRNFETGGAAINQLCRAYGADLRVVALDLDRPTADFTQAPAMTEHEMLDAVNRGAASVPETADLILLGEMGIGNTTVAAALAAALFGGPAADWAGPGTGLGAAGLARKVAAVDAGLGRHRDQLGDPLGILQALGGREQAALAGAILAARLRRIPVLLDGYVCCAAAAVLHRLRAGALDHGLVGHCSAEPGHDRLLRHLGQDPMLRLDMRLGEATGAAMALGLLRGALACHDGMATFAEAGVATGDAAS